MLVYAINEHTYGIQEYMYIYENPKCIYNIIPKSVSFAQCMIYMHTTGIIIIIHIQSNSDRLTSILPTYMYSCILLYM